MVIGGDFNGRVAEDGQLIDHSMQLPSKVSRERTSMDKVRNKRGINLLNNMSEEGLFLFNGRTYGDIPGQFTFVGKQGKSTIDLTFGNQKAASRCQQLEIVHLPYSYHFPIFLQLNTLDKEDSVIQSHKIKWDASKRDSFNNTLQQHFSLGIPTSFDKFTEQITNTVFQHGMIKKYTLGRPKGKIWFNKECREARKAVNKLRQAIKSSGWSSINTTLFHTTKSRYKALCRKNSQEHKDLIKKQLANCKDTKQYWLAVKQVKQIPTPPNLISEQKWIDFHKSIMPQRELSSQKYEGNVVREVEEDFTMGELQSALDKLAPNKAPGPDHIPNEILKNLNARNKEVLLGLLNGIMQQERVPSAWSHSTTAMLYKKGDQMDPANFRPIALLNTSLKLFTSILNERIIVWSNNNNKLPEAQGGFRKGRGCIEQIFCLNTAIQHCLNKKKGCMYAIFIDFERAFNTLSHNKLWDKLYKLGMSGKLIRILKSLYEKATTSIRTEHGLTAEIEITEGVLQGEVLSPLLFSLYISDIEDIILDAKIHGIKITKELALHILLFADDMVVVAPTPFTLQKKINHLREYFVNLGLRVNLSKTKVMVFRKGGRLRSGLSFMYGNERIEIVNEYKYLGVLFSRSGVFSKATVEFKQRGKAALAAVWNIVFKGQIQNLTSKAQLYNSIVTPTALYGSQIWSLRYLESMEQLQHTFIKRALGISRLAPSYLLGLETGMQPLACRIIKLTFRFVIKLLKMNNDRYAKQCFLSLLCIKTAYTDIRYNWIRQIDNILDKLDLQYLLVETDPQIWRDHIPLALEKIRDNEKGYAWYRVEESNRFSWFAQIGMQENAMASYLKLNLPFRISTIISQTRLNGGTFYFDKKTFILNSDRICQFCNLEEEDSLDHIIFRCRLHNGSRGIWLCDLITEGTKFPNIMTLDTNLKCRSMYNFIIESLKTRRLINNEEDLLD